MLVFVPGAGRSGVAAWPAVQRDGQRYLDLAALTDPHTQAGIVEDATPDGAVVVAHSYGAVAVALALRGEHARIGGLVLIEPALYDVARGDPAVERFIATMAGARHDYERGGLAAYWAVVRPLMFGGPFAPDRWDAEAPIAARMHALADPWGLGITASEITRTPTLLVTGGWNDEYEAIAAALVRAGADHRTLVGAKHRPHDLEAFGPLLDDFVARCR